MRVQPLSNARGHGHMDAYTPCVYSHHTHSYHNCAVTPLVTEPLNPASSPPGTRVHLFDSWTGHQAPQGELRHPSRCGTFRLPPVLHGGRQRSHSPRGMHIYFCAPVYFSWRDSQKQNCCVNKHENLNSGSVWHPGAVSFPCW